jgi:hypothetical protein
MYAVVEVEDGQVDLTCSDSIDWVVIDWDNVRDDEDYAHGKLNELNELAQAGTIPQEFAHRLAEGIRQSLTSDEDRRRNAAISAIARAFESEGEAWWSDHSGDHLAAVAVDALIGTGLFSVNQLGVQP